MSSTDLTEIAQASVNTDFIVNRRLDAYQLNYMRLKQGRVHLSKQVAMAPNTEVK